MVVSCVAVTKITSKIITNHQIANIFKSFIIRDKSIQKKQNTTKNT